MHDALHRATGYAALDLWVTGARRSTGRPAASTAAIRRQVYVLATGRAGGAVLQALTLGLLARSAGPTDFGVAVGVTGAGQAAMAIADLGISPTLLRVRARNPNDDRIRRLLRLNLFISIGLGVVGVLVLACGSVVTARSEYALLAGVGVWIAAEKNTEARLMVPLADGRTGDLLRSLLLRRLVSIVVLATALALSIPALASYSAALAISGIVGARWSTRQIRSTLPPTAVPGGKAHLLREALPFWLNSVAIQLRAVDVSVVRLFASGLEAGIYAAPSRLTGALSLVPNSIAQVVLPHAARGDRRAVAVLVRSLTAVMLVMAVAFGLLALFARPILIGALGAGFADSARPLQIILLGVVCMGISSSLLTFLQARGDEWFVALTSMSATAGCLVGAAFGARIAGASGAAIALTCSNALLLAVLLTRLKTQGSRLWSTYEPAGAGRAAPTGKR